MEKNKSCSIVTKLWIISLCPARAPSAGSAGFSLCGLIASRQVVESPLTHTFFLFYLLTAIFSDTDISKTTTNQ